MFKLRIHTRNHSPAMVQPKSAQPYRVQLPHNKQQKKKIKIPRLKAVKFLFLI